MKALRQAALASLLAVGRQTQAAPTCPDTLDTSAQIDDSATLYYAAVPSDPPEANNGIFCARLEVEHDGWVGLAFSPAGAMDGSTGVLGLDGAVKKYELFTYGVNEMPEAQQTLIDASIAQEGDLTIMSFTKLLVEEGEVAIAEGSNNLLHARGGDTVGYHGTSRFPFTVELEGLGAPAPATSGELQVGDEVCVTNFIMDIFCINQGFFIDDTDTMTLEKPEEHSFHCLLDVPQCQESGYVVLTDKNEETGMHCLGYRLDDTQAVLEAGFAAGQEGYCTGCTGDESAPEYGYRATVRGTVKELGDGSNGVTGTPVLEDITLLDESEECETPTVVEPVCMEPAPDASSDLKVGDEVCISNYVMDQYCIGLGHFLDNNDVMTLEHPEEHSFHCLLDVGLCKDSGYTVLGPKDDETGMHCIGYRLQETERVIEAGLAAGQKGYCTDCTGDDSKPTRGYMATIKGTVQSLGDGSDGLGGAPILENIEVLDASVQCETTTLPPQCTGDASTVPPPVGPPSKDCSVEICTEQLSDDLLLEYFINVPDGTDPEVCGDCSISIVLKYDGEAWVAIGFSEDGLMIGSEAVIGTPDDGKVLKYFLGGKTDSAVEPMPESQQTLEDPKIEVMDGRTVMEFTKMMKEPGEIQISTGDNMFIWAHGAGTDLTYHGITSKGSVELNLSSGASEAVAVPYMSAWLAHGIMAFLAWGVFTPFAVQSSLLRSLLPEGLWFKLHRGFNVMGFSLFICAFSVAVAYVTKEEGIHFDNNHERMGLAMFIMAFIQVFGGIARPHLPEPDSEDEKTSVRKGWEVGHRVMGVALLACGFWQMAEGIKLYSGKYSVSSSDENAVTIAYWVWIGVMAAIIVLGGGYFKYKAQAEADNEAPPADSATPDEGLVMAPASATKEEGGEKEEEIRA